MTATTPMDNYRILSDREVWLIGGFAAVIGLITVLLLSGCPYVEACIASGLCPEPSPGKSSPPDTGSATPDAAETQHVHCGPNTVFCWGSDGHCCSVCGGRCS